MVVDKAAHAKVATVDAGRKAVDYTSEKAVQAKNATIDAGQKTAAYAAEKAAQAKGKVVGAGQSAISSGRETATTAKDTVKSTVGFKPNEEVEGKDRASGEAKVMSITMSCRM